MYGFVIFFLTLSAVYAHRRKVGYSFDENDNSDEQRKRKLFKKLIDHIERGNIYANLFRSTSEPSQTKSGSISFLAEFKSLNRKIYKRILRLLGRKSNSHHTVAYEKLIFKEKQNHTTETNSLLDGTSNKTFEIEYTNEQQTHSEHEHSKTKVNRLDALLNGRGFTEHVF